VRGLRGYRGYGFGDLFAVHFDNVAIGCDHEPSISIASAYDYFVGDALFSNSVGSTREMVREPLDSVASFNEASVGIWAIEGGRRPRLQLGSRESAVANAELETPPEHNLKNEYRLKLPKGPVLALPFSACTWGDRIARHRHYKDLRNIPTILELPTATLMKCAD
jgi:hypothetical protein